MPLEWETENVLITHHVIWSEISIHTHTWHTLINYEKKLKEGCSSQAAKEEVARGGRGDYNKLYIT